MAFLDVLGAIASPVSSLIGAGVNAINMSQQKKLMQMNQDFQSAENEKNRQWQSDEWTRQFDLTNAYNDPTAVVKRLTDAGLNAPQVLSGSGASSPAVTSHATPSAPSGGTSASPSPDYSGVITSGFQSMQHIANSIKMLTEAKKTAKETPYVGAMLDSQIQLNLAKFENEQAKADYQKLQNQIEGALGFQIRSKELAKLVSETLLADQEAKLKGAQIELVDVEKLEKQMNALVSYCEANKKQAEADRIRALLEPEIALLRSQANQANASAEHSRALADTENVLRSIKRGLAENELKFNTETYHDRVDALRENLDASILSNEKVRESLEKMKFANSVKEFDYWYNMFLKTITTMLAGVPGRVSPQEFGAIQVQDAAGNLR